MRRKWAGASIGLLGAALALATAAPASAALAVFTTSGQTATIDYNGSIDGTPQAGLSAEITFTFTGFTSGGTVANFDFSVLNTSTSPVTSSRVSTFGLDTTPDAISAAITGGTVYDATSSGNVPGLGSFEFCATAGSTCSGGAGGGALEGGPAITGSFALTFANATTSVSFDDAFVRYQSITTPTVTDGSGVGSPITVIPEPGTWGLLIVGVGFAGAVLRRQRRLVVC